MPSRSVRGASARSAPARPASLPPAPDRASPADRSAAGGPADHPAAGGPADLARLGIDRLRPGQERAVDALCAGRDALVVMPTGSGKSAVFLVAGARRGGLTLVVSPLRALQRDQVPAAARLGPAAACNADLSQRRRREVLASVEDGSLRYLFTGPEQLQRPDLVQALAASPPTLLAVDEAHTLSAWGPDFRPDYLRVGSVVGLLDHPPVVALTATAAPPVRADIATRLGLVDPLEVVEGFDRPEIHLAVEHHHDPAERDRSVVERAARMEGTGLVYCATKARAASLAVELVAAGVTAAAYHAGMTGAERRRVEEGWKEGSLRVVVATSAFGMGIDKADVRFVLHAEMPESLDAYAQETGRAGRDGAPATAVLYHRTEDASLRRFFASRRPPRTAEVAAVLGALARAGGPLDALALAQEVGAAPGRRLARVLAAAEASGALEVLPGGAIVLTPNAPSPEEVAGAGRRAAGAVEQLERSRVEMLERYAGTGACRRRVLLAYFGQEAPERCGSCDACDRAARPGTVTDDASSSHKVSGGSGESGEDDSSGLDAGARVRHGAFGDGEVLTNEDGTLTVVFDDVGYRTLDLQLVEDGHLLAPINPPGSPGS